MQIYQGNLKPELVVTLTDGDNRPLRLAEAVRVRVRLFLDGELFIDRASDEPDDQVTVDNEGRVTMEWRPTDTDELGVLGIEVLIQWVDGEQTVALDETVEIVAPGADRPGFLTVEELRDHMSGRVFTPPQERDARRTLRRLTRNLERKLNRRFELAEATEWVFTDESGFGYLNRSPVRTLLGIDGTDLADGLPVLGYGFTAPHVSIGGVHGLAPLTWVQVRYRGGGGLAGDDLEDVKLGILEKAAQIMTTRHDDAVTVQDLNISEPTQRPPEFWAWTAEELSPYEHLRRRIAL